jgi:hypothetical protein
MMAEEGAEEMKGIKELDDERDKGRSTREARAVFHGRYFKLRRR